MEKKQVEEEFENKFKELNKANKQYILGITQALSFAQSCKEKNIAEGEENSSKGSNI